MNRYKIAKILSLVATVMCVVGVYGLFTEPEGTLATICYIGVLLTLVTYCICGLGEAFKICFSFARKGLRDYIFPYNLCQAVIFFCLGVLLLMFVPVFPVFRAAAKKAPKEVK